MITIKVHPGQDPNRAIQKLKNMLILEGLFMELKRRKYYAKPSVKKKMKKEEAERQKVKDQRRLLARVRQEEDSYLY